MSILLNILSVFIGGGIGAFLRYAVSLLAKKVLLPSLIGTLSVNLIGCLIIGYIFNFTQHKINGLSENLRLFIVIGILGSLTTFSTLNIEAFELIKSGKITTGLIYIFSSSLFGLLFTFLGYGLYSIQKI